MKSLNDILSVEVPAAEAAGHTLVSVVHDVSDLGVRFYRVVTLHEGEAAVERFRSPMADVVLEALDAFLEAGLDQVHQREVRRIDREIS